MRRLGRELSPQVAARMQALVESRPNGGYGHNRYRLADYGLDAGEQRARFAAYVAHFDVEPEEPAELNRTPRRYAAPCFIRCSASCLANIRFTASLRRPAKRSASALTHASEAARCAFAPRIRGTT